MSLGEKANNVAFSSMLLSVASMRKADELTISYGAPGIELMEQAGRGVAEKIMQIFPTHTKVLVVCGPGNNGGDGFIAARILLENSYNVMVALLGVADDLKGDAAEAAERWAEPMFSVGEINLEEFDVVIDALFGAGLNRPLDGEALDIVERINAAGKVIVSVDIPSGISGDTGAISGEAVRATHTVTFAAYKPGHFLYPGAAYVGELSVVDIGISPQTIEQVHEGLFANGPGFWQEALPQLEYGSHKYTRGHALVLSGGITATGAARLAARGALRIGAGLVTIAAPPVSVPIHASQLTAIMLREMASVDDLNGIIADKRFNAVVLGPALGVGNGTQELVAAVVKAGRPIVLDADALTSFAGSLDTLARLTEKTDTVVTPHEGEFFRLFNNENEILKGFSKIERAKFAANYLKATVVLKGADTIIAAPDGRVCINTNGTPLLATAGTGDVLAGMIGGLLAQGMSSFEAASAAVWLHAEAARNFGPGLIAEDVPEMLPTVLHKWHVS
ncbi:NAD(P)H-hydrate dehydratase [Microvirga sp. W0021]|uniref:Bifunctional NAD(P)H-hydrate repair enzyme n=1 Tax=Hohaiivirga grylli TaxID=3133970 RepID=A0ABV0BKC1_9HYPH